MSPVGAQATPPGAPSELSTKLLEQLDSITRGAADLVSREDLERRLRRWLAAERGPLRVKAGFDPTRPDLHLGHCVLLQKLRAFQDLGHVVIFLIGDYTAMVGDPTGINETRPRLTMEQVMAAASTYQQQAFKVLRSDPELLEIRRNSEWLGKLSTLDFIELTSRRTLARTLERRDFRQRFEAAQDVYLHELLYPLLQAYDSVALECDIELGGTDQLFNLNVGRDLMPRYGKEAQCVLTVPLLEGTDAHFMEGKIVGKKMSKSADNYIGIDEPPSVMMRKCMQIDDEVIWRYYELLSRRPWSEVLALRERSRVASSFEERVEPKRLFAQELIARFHDEAAAHAAWDEFHRVYLDRSGTPDQISEFDLPCDARGLWIAKALASAGLAPSTSEGKRMVKQGQVELDGVRITDDTLKIPLGKRVLLRAGSKNRRFAYVTSHLDSTPGT